ncbi:MAG: amino acid permease [Ignavibacteria bacterium]|nr:amino acid permease [Ignavibacteria bacterium]
MFKRTFGTFDATMIVAGSMIGSGIFIVSADIARSVESPLLLMMVWVVTGVLTLIAALSYGELAGMMPHAGGQYVYLREAFGPLPGFLYGWTLFAVIQTGTIAAVAMAFAKFTSVLIPFFSDKNIVFTWRLAPGTWHVTGAHILAIVSIIFLTALNARGVRLGRFIQNIFTSTKVVAVVALALIGIVVGWGSTSFTVNIQSFNSTSFVLTAFVAAMVGSIFSSDAWNNITFIAGEVKEPHKTIPRGLAYGVIIVTVLYLAVNVSYLTLLPVHGVSDGASVIERGISYTTNDRVGTAAAEVMFGGAGAVIMAVLILISTFGCNNGLILSGARAYWAMARDKLFFKGAGDLNKNDVPGKGLWIQAVWASALCLSGSYSDLLDYVVFAVLIFYALTIGGIFRLRFTRPDADRPYKAFGYPWLPLLYIILAVTICIVLLVAKPNYTWPGLMIVAVGLPVYFFWKQKK